MGESAAVVLDRAHVEAIRLPHLGHLGQLALVPAELRRHREQRRNQINIHRLRAAHLPELHTTVRLDLGYLELLLTFCHGSILCTPRWQISHKSRRHPNLGTMPTPSRVSASRSRSDSSVCGQ